MQSVNDVRWWSWADILRNLGRLGVPHFQRGAVWDASNRTALLESLYEQSPCGTFVFWSPEDIGGKHRHGVPLRAFEPDVAPLWIVDGQQRTRAMVGTFEELLETPVGEASWSLVRNEDLLWLRNLSVRSLGGFLEDDDHSDDADGDSEDEGVRFWGVLMPALRDFEGLADPHFARYSESRHVQRGSMFRRLTPRARVRIDARSGEKPVPPLPAGVVPLATLLAPVSIVHDESLRSAAAMALRSFTSSTPDLDALDALVPWGPQFVAGHAYERPAAGGGPLVPVRWADLQRRRDANVDVMVAALAWLLTPRWRAVLERFPSMLNGDRFAVGWLPPSDVSAAIDAYVRINRAGVRVRPEEKALALLSRAYPHLLDDLARYTRLRDRHGGGVADERVLLQHQAERQMGFAVWMSTVTRFTALSLSGTPAVRWLGTTAIDKQGFGYRLDRVGPSETPVGKRTWAREDYASAGEIVQESAARATRALVLIDDIVAEELSFDHRMARPATRGLQPMIDLLYRVPEVALEQLKTDRGFRAAVARLLHWTLLAPYIDQPDLNQLVVDVHDVDGSPGTDGVFRIAPWSADASSTWREQLRAALGRYQRSLLRLWSRKIGTSGKAEGLADSRSPSLHATLGRLAVNTFQVEVSAARSLQHAMVGWLYAIERRGGAQEFCWEAQLEGFRDSGGKAGVPELPVGVVGEAPLARMLFADSIGLSPERQHIVPFALARQVTGKGGTRATASPANAIGNLTWLSQRQNGLGALSDRWAVMDLERDGANLEARGMLARYLDQEDARSALELYEALRTSVARGGWREVQAEAQTLFDAFCRVRARWMVTEMERWLGEPLPEAASWWLRDE